MPTLVSKFVSNFRGFETEESITLPMKMSFDDMELFSTVSPLYNDIRYNGKIRYNVNLACTKSADRVFFSFGQSHVIL